jgi:tryptophanyl-tRNA synthetase
MGIVTDSTPVAEPKPTRGNTLYALLRLLTAESDWPATRRFFTEGGHGYGEIKKHLLGLLLDTFRAARERREELQRDPGFVEGILARGAERAHAVADDLMRACRRACGTGD